MNVKKAFPIIAMLLVVLVVGCKKEDEIGIHPEITSADPINKEANGDNLTISATFNKAMDPSSITTSSFIVKQAGANVSGKVSYSGMTATFTPTANLKHHTAVRATITKEAKDTSGKSLSNDYEWDFTTCHPPTVISVNPPDLAKCVALDKAIKATFSDETDPLTVTASTFTLMTGATLVSGAVTYSGTTGTFTPTSNLLPATTYTATITTGVKNGLGMPLENAYVWSFTTTGPLCNIGEVEACGPTKVDLKTAGRFGILAGVGISNNAGPSIINDLDVGISPGFRSSVTGFPPAIILNGAIYSADDLVSPGISPQAQLDLTDAYLFAEAATSPAPVILSGDQGGKTLVPGIYKSTSTLLIQSGNLTLDAQSPCDSTAVWIFQVGSALTTVGGGGGNIILSGGAKAKNVFWQVGSSATIGDGTSFKGNVLALTSITMGSGATAEGRMLARNGAVVLTNTNTITKP